MITSKEKYGLGTVWVLDALHVPFGCRSEIHNVSRSCETNTQTVYGLRSGVAEQISNILMVCTMIKGSRRS